MQITIEAIQAAYAKHSNIAVLSCSFRKIIDGQLIACCPMSILALEDGNDLLDDNFSVMEWIDEKFGNEAQDFWKGFDQRRWYDRNDNDSSKYYRLGFETRKILIKE